MNKIIEAIRFAAKAHEGQLRKAGNIPFITHPIAVAGYVAMLPDSTEDMVVAAALHDTCEDCDITQSDIEDFFGMEVGRFVNELTNLYTNKAYPHLNRKRRKQLEMARIKSISYEAKVIKLADRLHNLESRGLSKDHLRKNYLPESLELVNAIGDACPDLAERCRNVIKELELCI